MRNPARAKARLHRVLTSILAVSIILTTPLAGTAQPEDVIVLPGATSAEGVAVGQGSTFYAGDLFKGDIYRGDLQVGTAERFIEAPAGRMAIGMKVDQSGRLLFVAGGFTGQGYVYDTESGATLAVYQFADPAAGTLINDAAITQDGVWFTDTFQPQLYFVPVGPGGSLGTFRTLTLTGPAAAMSGEFNLNGIDATANGDRLIVSHTDAGKLYAVDPETGASAEIAGVSVPNVDGILLEAGRLWAVQNFDNQIAQIRLSPDLTAGVVEELITDSRFQVPTTVARHGSDLVVVNGKFDTGLPPTATEYEVVIVHR